MTKDEALQMCLEYIETDAHERRYVRWAINEALAQPAQEPVAWMSVCDVGFKRSEFGDTPTVPLYTTPPQRPWVSLTDDAEIFAISNTMPYADRFEFARAIEAKLKEKNNAA